MGDDQDLAERGELLSSFGMGGMGMDGLEDDAGVPLLSAVDDSNVPPSLATARATATLRELAQNYGGDNGGSDGGVGRWNVESNSLESPTLGRLPLLQQQQQQQEQHEAAISAGYSDQQATAEESQAERNVAEGREKLPEMQERTGSMPLIAQLAPGSGGRQQSAAKDTMDMDMDIS